MITESSPIVTICAICTDKVDLSAANFLMCGHIFHQNCLGAWLNIKQCCPTCKQSAAGGAKKFYDLKLVETITANAETQTSHFYHSVKSTLKDTFLGALCDNDFVGEFQGTEQCKINGATDNGTVRQHTWQLKSYPGGDTQQANGYVSIHIPASTTETRPVTISGVIRIINTEFQKNFKFNVSEGVVNTIPKFISHHELQILHGIINGEVTVECEAIFETHGNELI